MNPSPFFFYENRPSAPPSPQSIIAAAAKGRFKGMKRKTLLFPYPKARLKKRGCAKNPGLKYESWAIFVKAKVSTTKKSF